MGILTRAKQLLTRTIVTVEPIVFYKHKMLKKDELPNIMIDAIILDEDNGGRKICKHGNGHAVFLHEDWLKQVSNGGTHVKTRFLLAKNERLILISKLDG